MKFTTTLLLGLTLAFMVGCGNTAEGMKEDSQINSQKAAESSQKGAEATKDAAKDVQAATLLTPKIKMAISAETLLNDSKNLINVDSTEEKVTLEGHVTSMELKDLAGKIAAKVLADNSAKQPLENKLEIKP